MCACDAYLYNNLSVSSMQTRLSANGVDKLMGGMGGMVVQLLSLDAKNQNNQCYYACEISDGFCRAKGCVMEMSDRPERERLEENGVVKVIRSTVQKNKKQKSIIIVEVYEFVANIQSVIGKPIPYDDYIKNGKNNPEGDNLIPTQRPAKVANKVESRPQRSFSECSEETKSNNDENSRFKLNPSSKNQPKTIQNASNNTGNTNTTSRSIAPPPVQNSRSNSLPQPKQQAKVIQKQVKQKGPIQRLPIRKQERGSESMRQRKPQSEYNQIRSFHVGMENWTILGRVISLNPLKSFINKKGIESSLLSFDIGDASGSIECTIYGQIAQRYQGSLKEDQLYEISNGFINETSYLGVHKLKLIISENTKVSLREDDPSVPYMQDFCLSIKKLTEVPVGEEVRVICLVKDTVQVQTFLSRQGKPLKKKTVVFCDPVDRVEVQVTLWNDSVGTQFQCYPYMIKGIQVKEYQGTRQYSLRNNSRITVLKQHSLRKYIKDLQAISFSNPDSNRKGQRRTGITNIQDLNNAMDEVTESGTWSQVVCFITAMRQSGKFYYISCPKCKKKVAEVDAATCVHCAHPYDEAQYRYVLSLNLADYTDSLWVNAYDDAGEALLGVSARVLAAMKEEEVQEHIKKIRYKHKKVRMVTKNDEFNGAIRKKTTIIKVIHFNFAEETKNLLEKVTALMPK